MKTHDNIRKKSTGQADDYTAGFFLDYINFNKHHKIIAIDLSKQQALDADPKEIQQVNFTRNLDREEGGIMFFIIEEAKETISLFHKEL